MRRHAKGKSCAEHSLSRPPGDGQLSSELEWRLTDLVSAVLGLMVYVPEHIDGKNNLLGIHHIMVFIFTLRGFDAMLLFLERLPLRLILLTLLIFLVFFFLLTFNCAPHLLSVEGVANADGRDASENRLVGRH